MVYSLRTHKKSNTTLQFFKSNDFENQNPIAHYGNTVIVKQMIINGVPRTELKGEKTFSNFSLKVFREAHEHWLKLKREFQAIRVPKNLIQLLKTDSKKEQVKLLNDFKLTPEILTSFTFMAYHEFGYTLSQYTSEISKKCSNPLAKIIDCGENWHCFFTTYSNNNSKETCFHYISKAFGIDRSEIVKQIKSGDISQDSLPCITLSYS